LAAIVLICQRCGTEVEDRPGEWALDGLCATCYATEILKPYQVEMVRLWNKYNHYAGKGISVLNQDAQIRAKFNRGLKRVLDSVPGIAPARAFELSVQILITEAQSQAAGFSRIVRPDGR
jgi:hypothetical protein